jgi:hypothetical protein
LRRLTPSSVYHIDTSQPMSMRSSSTSVARCSAKKTSKGTAKKTRIHTNTTAWEHRASADDAGDSETRISDVPSFRISIHLSTRLRGPIRADFHVVMIPSGCLCKKDFVQFWVYLNVLQAAPGFQQRHLNDLGGSPPK